MALARRRVGLDTAVFIYHLEGTSRLSGPAGVAFAELARGAYEGLTSTLTLMELTVKPLQLGRTDVAGDYERLLLHFPHLTFVSIDWAVARRAAALRAAHSLTPADALQVAACLHGGATVFLTNDKRLRRITELQVVILEDYGLA